MMIRDAQAQDLEPILKLWHDLYTLDHYPPERFLNVVHNATQLVVEQDGIVGYVAVEVEGDKGYLKAIAARPDQLEPVFAALIQAVENRLPYLTVIDCCRAQSGGYFHAGIDVRYPAVISALKHCGFREDERLFDARIQLDTWTLNAFQHETLLKLQAHGIQIDTYNPSDEPAMKVFIEHSEFDFWFPAGWQATPMLVAKDGERIVGYAQYQPGAFGPAAVLPDYRQKRVGSGLLIHAMQRMQALGVRHATAEWVWPLDYYLKNGWEVDREFSALQKDLT